MQRRGLGLLICLAMTGCMQSGAAPLDQVPVESATLSGQYVAIANCAYLRLDKASGSGIKKIDLQNETRLALESGGVRYWELTFVPAGKGTTVSFTQVQTMWGPLGAKEVMPIVRSCG